MRHDIKTGCSCGNFKVLLCRTRPTGITYYIPVMFLCVNRATSFVTVVLWEEHVRCKTSININISNFCVSFRWLLCMRHLNGVTKWKPLPAVFAKYSTCQETLYYRNSDVPSVVFYMLWHREYSCIDVMSYIADRFLCVMWCDSFIKCFCFSYYNMSFYRYWYFYSSVFMLTNPVSLLSHPSNGVH
jgi:hypothetical protein